MHMNEIKESGSSLLRRLHAQLVLSPEYSVCPLPAAPYHEKGADAEFSAGSYRDVC